MHKTRKLQGSCKLPQAHEKVCNENERKIVEEKRCTHKDVFNGSEEFIRHLWKGHVMDINEPQVNDSSYNEGNICFVNE